MKARARIKCCLILTVFISLITTARCIDEPLAEWKSLEEKYNSPPIPKVVRPGNVWYQLFVLPEVKTKINYPVIVTIFITLDSNNRAEKAEFIVHAEFTSKMAIVGTVQLDAQAANDVLQTIGCNEIFSLPLRSSLMPYELFARLGGNRYVIARRDANGSNLVMRMDWECVPMQNVFSALMKRAIPYLK